MASNDVEVRNDLEKVISEKNELERALASVSELLETTVTEKEQLGKLFADFKLHFQSVKS